MRTSIFSRPGFWKEIITSILLLSLFGCGAQRGAQRYAGSFDAGLSYVSPEERDVYEPPIGQRGTVAIGETITSHSKEAKTKIIEVLNSKTVKGFNAGDYIGEIEIPKGAYKIKALDNNGSEYYRIGSTKVKWFYKEKFSTTEDVEADIRLKQDGQLEIRFTYPEEPGVELYEADANSLSIVKSDQVVSTTKPTLRRELIYTGRNGPSVTLMYREFINDMARPAFTQVLQYDISTDPIIGYQGARFKVISANNVSITFDVINTLAPK